MAKYLSHEVTAAEIMEEQRRWAGIEDFGDFRSRIVDMALAKEFSRLAREIGLDKTDFYLQRNMVDLKREQLSRLFIDRVLVHDMEVSDEEIERVLSTKTFDDSVKGKLLLPKEAGSIGDIQQEVEKGESFERLMEKYGTDRGRFTGGKEERLTRTNSLFSRGNTEEIFSHREGDIVGPLKTQIGDVFFLIESKMNAEQAREVARVMVERRLRRKKKPQVIEDAVTELEKKYDVEVFEEGTYQNVRGVIVRVDARVDDVIITGKIVPPGTHGHTRGRHLKDSTRKIRKEIRDVLFMKEAERLGLDKEEHYRREMEKELDRQLFKAYQMHIYSRPVDFSEEDLIAYFNSNKERSFYIYREASYFVIRKIKPENLEQIEGVVGEIDSKSSFQKILEELQMNGEIVLKQKEPQMPKPLAEEIFKHRKGDVLELKNNDGSSDLFKVIDLNLLEEYPRFEDIRANVERSFVDNKQIERLNEFLVGEIEKVEVNDEKARKLFEVYLRSI